MLQETLESLELQSFKQILKSWLRWPFQMTLLEFRSIIFAPLFEEIVFRVLMCGALQYGKGDFSILQCVLIPSIIFGLAHVHHVIEHVTMEGYSLKSALLIVGFQFCYTLVFGCFASYIYVKTGQLSAATVMHVYCNIMGVPAFGDVWSSDSRWLLIVTYIIGLSSFIYFFNTLTTIN